jgi:hypothetical protein
VAAATDRAPTASDVPEIDAKALFGTTGRVTGTETYVPGGITRSSVLAFTSERFGVAAECAGHGTITVEVTRPLADAAGNFTDVETLASYTLACPMPRPTVLEADFGGAGAATSLNIGVRAAQGLYWRAILVDLQPGG